MTNDLTNGLNKNQTLIKVKALKNGCFKVPHSHRHLSTYVDKYVILVIQVE